MSSTVAQKLIALFFLTAVLVIPNELISDRFVHAQGAATAVVGQKAPDFNLQDANGKSWKLKDLKGKIVVLEWFNHGCPFVKKHYETNNMQKLQKKYTGKGITWFCINSSAAGKQGNAAGSEHAKVFKEKGAAPTAILIDGDGKVGKEYGAKTTPHMFVIDKKGVLAYAGAIDDKSGTDASEVASAKNYVGTALDEMLAGKPVTTSSSKAYGCSIKYQQ